MSPLTEDTLVQQTTADYLHDELGWESVYAYNTETFGPGDRLLLKLMSGEIRTTQWSMT